MAQDALDQLVLSPLDEADDLHHAAFIQIPAQIIRGGRRIVYRLLSWNAWQQVLFRLLDQLRPPLRC
jgi:hypothetical protein